MIMLNETPPLIRQCAWCRALARPDGSWTAFVMDSETSKKVNLISTHGICPKCAANEIAKLKQGRAGR